MPQSSKHLNHLAKFALLLFMAAAQLGCLVGPPQYQTQYQTQCRHGCRHHPGRYPSRPSAGQDVLGDIARTFNRLVVGVDYVEPQINAEPQLADEAIGGNPPEPAELLPEPLPSPPPVEWSPPPAPVQEAPPLESSVPYMASETCPPTGSPVAAPNGPPGRFFPLPVRPVFSPRPPAVRFQ